MSGLSSIEHVVVLMLENRSLDHMLGYLYSASGNVSPTGSAFEGLTGNEQNLDASGTPVKIFQISSSTPNAYSMPGSDPGEGYMATNSQLFGSTQAPADGTAATMNGFVADYTYTLGWESAPSSGYTVLPGTTAGDIMGCYTPEALPVLSGLARGFAACDHWYGSAPTETLPNRALACLGTSQGHLDDKTRTFTAPSIFGTLTNHGIDWAVYGYDAQPLARYSYTDITNAAATHFGLFPAFTAAAAAGTLAPYAWLEPSWGASGNSQHPNYDVALGEQLIHDVYYALRNGPAWNQTLLIVTYDEHGGLYDHVPPPWGAIPPDNAAGEYGFDFTRFGPRVPTVLVSPLIEAGTVFRAPNGGPPLDHTSILKTVENRWGLPALTARDGAAPDVSGVLTLATARTDDPLAGVTVPAAAPAPAAAPPSHLQWVLADLISRQHRAGTPEPVLRTEADADQYTRMQ